MHAEALTKEGAKLFPHISKFTDFYLVGGTALALHIGHRVSVDFDLFSSTPLADTLLPKIKRVFDGKRISVTYRSPEQINLLINDVKFTFFYYSYPTVDTFVQMQNVPVASIPELASMKAFALGKRLSYKDYVDWYFLLEEKHVTLEQVMEISKRKFGGDFSDRLFLGQLVSMDEIPTQKIDFLRGEIGRKVIEEKLENQVKNFEF